MAVRPSCVCKAVSAADGGIRAKTVTLVVVGYAADGGWRPWPPHYVRLGDTCRRLMSAMTRRSSVAALEQSIVPSVSCPGGYVHRR